AYEGGHARHDEGGSAGGAGAGGVRAVEPLEDPVGGFGWHTRAVVAHLECGPTGRGPHGDLHCGAFGGVLDGIADQVRDHLPYTLGIRIDPDNTLCEDVTGPGGDESTHVIQDVVGERRDHNPAAPRLPAAPD